jgi:hypothetical protein
MSTINFVKSIGFDAEGKAIKMDFTFDAVNASTGQRTERTLHVPILTMVPVPFLRVRSQIPLTPLWFCSAPHDSHGLLCCFLARGFPGSRDNH